MPAAESSAAEAVHTDRAIASLIAFVDELRVRAVELETNRIVDLQRLSPRQRSSAANLLHYMATRQYDLRQLQLELHHRGLSSLGRMEAYTMASLSAVAHALRKLGGDARPNQSGEADRSNENGSVEATAEIGFQDGRNRLAENTDRLFGVGDSRRDVRIMVTIPSEAADRPGLLDQLVAAGMDVMRINCAKDNPERWKRMIDHLRAAERRVGRSCRVLMDLAGPNPRTGPLQPAEVDIEIDPPTDSFGQVTDCSRVWVASSDVAPKEADAILPLQGDLPRQFRPGDRLELTCLDHKTPLLRIVDVEPSGGWAECWEPFRVAIGSEVRLNRSGQSVGRDRVAELPGKLTERSFRVRPDDPLILTGDGQPGRPPQRNDDGEIVQPGRVSCSLSEILADVRVGDRVFYDDGHMEAIVEQASPEALHLRVKAARKGAAKIKSGKGLNFPDTAIDLDSLTEEDVRTLEFIAPHADMVGFSFVRVPADVDRILAELERLDARQLGLVLKIETRTAFENLPELLIAGMRCERLGVMVARGDMAAELGFERMSEVQEQILWLCEAAHTPVIWATEVLASLAKKGVPTRGDVTDAAMSGRAECVMLNKGEYIVRAVEFLADVLGRMSEHQVKKFARLRPLHVCFEKTPGERYQPAASARG